MKLNLDFKKLYYSEALTANKESLVKDVLKFGGESSRIVNYNGQLIRLIASSNRGLCGLQEIELDPIIISEEIDMMEAIHWSIQELNSLYGY